VALAGAIRRLAGDSGAREELRSRARRRAATLPSDDDAVVAALGIYRRAVRLKSI
jgi:hypothetical protein